jgi:hypothetical protein
MNNIADVVLSKEKANSLKELGLSFKDAVMSWQSMLTEPTGNPIRKRKLKWNLKFNILHESGVVCDGLIRREVIPTLTLQEIINLLPKSITVDNDCYNLRIEYHISDYVFCYFRNGDLKEILTISDPNILQAAYKTLCETLSLTNARQTE